MILSDSDLQTFSTCDPFFKLENKSTPIDNSFKNIQLLKYLNNLIKFVFLFYKKIVMKVSLK